MTKRFIDASRLRHLMLAAAGCVALVVGSAHGSASADLLQPALDVAFGAVFEAGESAFSAEQSLEPVDLRDGRSAMSPRWRQNFAEFADRDRKQPPAAGGVVFVGSSSISFWSDLPTQFAKRNVIQRGLAGANMADCARHADRLILPYRPSAVVVYAGDNDLAEGVAPEQIVAAYADLVRQVHDKLPASRIVFVSIKPSPSREALMPKVRRTNALMAAYALTDRRLDFVDVFTPMLDRPDHARRDLFLADGLHMNAAGYALWRNALVHHLD